MWIASLQGDSLPQAGWVAGDCGFGLWNEAAWGWITAWPLLGELLHLSLPPRPSKMCPVTAPTYRVAVRIKCINTEHLGRCLAQSGHAVLARGDITSSCLLQRPGELLRSHSVSLVDPGPWPPIHCAAIPEVSGPTTFYNLKKYRHQRAFIFLGVCLDMFYIIGINWNKNFKYHYC